MIEALYYFGCWDSFGHFLHAPDGRRLWHGAGPFHNDLDSEYAPKGGVQNEYVSEITHKGGWTVLAMWDRSFDTRPGSNAAFVAEGTHTSEDMWNAARQFFPTITARLKAAPKP